MASIENHIYGLKPEDDKLFENIFHKSSESKFCKNWLYAIRIARNEDGKLGYKILNNDTIIIGERKENIHVLTFSGIINLDWEFLHKHFRRKTIVVRKLSEDGYELLRNTGQFAEISEDKKNVVRR